MNIELKEKIARDILFLRDTMLEMQEKEYNGEKVVDENTTEYEAVFQNYYIFCACLDACHNDRDVINVMENMTTYTVIRFVSYLIVFEEEYEFYFKHTDIRKQLSDMRVFYMENLKEIL